MKIKPAYIFLSMIFLTCLVFLTLFNFKQFLFKPKPQVIGFLPYWNINEELEVDFEAVDQLIYFNIMVNGKGDIIKNSFSDKANGWYHLENNQQVNQLLKTSKEKNKKSLLCIASFDADVMYQVTLNQESRENLVENITQVVQEKDFDGVDMDFEYFWRYNHKETFGENFNLFLSELREKMDKVNPELILSVDIYPKAIIEDEPYELKEMAEIVDQIIIMAYDYTQSNSNQAGPVAPLNQETDEELKKRLKENYSIKQTLESAFQKATPDKWVLGIPLYGYQWQTADDQYRSQAINYGLAKTVQYKNVKELIEEKEPQINWSETSQSPWLVYKEGRNFYQLYYENLESLKAKFQLAEKTDLFGIAFWALGYENPAPEIWDYLK